MTLLRAGARTLLASYFVVSGVKALKNPAPLVPLAEPLADKLVPLVKQYAPARVASVIPEDATNLVRLNAAAQVVGGLALATGKGRRVGAALLAASLIPSTIAKHPFWTRDSAEERAADRSDFLKNVSLLGGVLLAARDTEGKPGLHWRAVQGSHALSRDTRRKGRQVVKAGSEFADTALAGGATLVSAVVASSRQARKAAAKQANEAREAAEQAAKQGRKLAKRARKVTAKQVAVSRKTAEKQLVATRKAAEKQLAATRKAAGRRAEKVREAAAEIASNIGLGEN